MNRIGLLSLVVVALVLTGCTTSDYSSNKTGWSDYSVIAVKDYTTVGNVRVESSETTIVGILGFTTEHSGSKVTYDMLLSEAIKLGADDIINVRIDAQRVGTRSIFEFITGYEETYNYVGNAIAIKYKGPIESAIESEGNSDSGMDKDLNIMDLF